MSKHFCCCIPVRAGVFIFSLIAFLSSAFVAGCLWFFLHEILTGADHIQNVEVDFSKVNTGGKIGVGVTAGVFTIVALISLFGFVGSVIRKRRFVKAYSYLSWLSFTIFFIASGFYFYLVFSGKNLFSGCQFTDNDGQTHDCKVDLPLWQKILSVAAIIIGLFIHLYIAVVVRRYVDQLEVEHDYKSFSQKELNKSTYEPTYYPPTAQDHAPQQGLLHHNTPYPYTDAAHSYGHTNA